MRWIWNVVSLATAGKLISRAWGQQSVFLTFDDGPDPVHTPILLDLLAENGAKATFFLLGSRVAAYPEIVGRIVSEGHTLGNHSFNHLRFDKSSMRVQWGEIERTESELQVFDQEKRHLVRPPHGRLGIRTLLVCLLRRQRIALWSCDSWDYRLNGPQVVERLESLGVRSGDVVLFHDDGMSGVEALRVMLPKWIEAGLHFGAL